MGCTTSTAKRRRKQMMNGNKHLDKLKRRRYSTGPGTTDAAARREARWKANRAKGL